VWLAENIKIAFSCGKIANGQGMEFMEFQSHSHTRSRSLDFRQPLRHSRPDLAWRTQLKANSLGNWGREDLP
jgi:hypothetical protein